MPNSPFIGKKASDRNFMEGAFCLNGRTQPVEKETVPDLQRDKCLKTRRVLSASAIETFLTKEIKTKTEHLGNTSDKERSLRFGAKCKQHIKEMERAEKN